MAGWFSIAVFVVAAAAGQRARPVVRPRPTAAAVLPLAGPTFALSVTHATITFNATDPDTPIASGDSPASVSWRFNGQNGADWNLTVRAMSDPLTNCPGVPASAITVTCTSVSGGQTPRSCAGAFPLSTARLPVASGREGNGNTNYAVQISYTINDTWNRVAQKSPPCSLSIEYLATLP